MKRLLLVFPLVILLCFTFGCQQGEEVAEETKEEITSGTVNVDGFDLTYSIEGIGIPCMVIDDPPVMKRVLSSELRKHFKFIFMDSRYSAQYDKTFDINKITLDTFLDDIDAVRETLGIEKICVFGHSINGFLAYEYARKYPEHSTHVIMNGTPPYWDDQFWSKATEKWESIASDESKEVLKQNWEKMGDKIAKMPPDQASLQTYIANRPVYLYNPNYDFTWLFEGLHWNAEIINHLFEVVVMNYDITQKKPIQTPVFLSLGRYDIVPFSFWEGIEEKFSNFSKHIFEKSAHYAFLEEQELFDKKLIEWIKSH